MERRVSQWTKSSCVKQPEEEERLQEEEKLRKLVKKRLHFKNIRSV